MNGHAAQFERWYAVYPRHVGRGQAERAFMTALKTATIDQLIAGAERYAKQVAGKEAQYVAYPATWLNGKRWLDESPPPPPPERPVFFG